MDNNLERSDTSEIDDIIEIPEDSNGFERLKNCQPPIISPEELIQCKPQKHRRYSTWMWKRDTAFTKERIRRQLNRSKTTVEEHVCYPWLRRLFFHLSNYFPNLHTTRSSRRYQPHPPTTATVGTTSASSSLAHRQSNLSTKRKPNAYIYKSQTTAYAESESQKTNRTGSVRHSNPVGTQLCRNNMNSPVISYAPDDNSNGNSNMNTRSKRRPLQRQKSKGFTELDLEPEISIRGRLTSSSSSENNQKNKNMLPIHVYDRPDM
ncbi:unnamed protein product [Heterobilharzia americana]|nr:unnamed protein product [Heterobilharzia americana]